MLVLRSPGPRHQVRYRLHKHMCATLILSELYYGLDYPQDTDPSNGGIDPAAFEMLTSFLGPVTARSKRPCVTG